MPTLSPRRLRVVGNSGAGKTTLARAAARRMGVAHLELDAVCWAEGWTKRDPEQARELIRGFLACDGARAGWVADGNWNSYRRDLLDDADAVVWLDYPRRVVMGRVIVRTLWRGLRREELWHGNRESLRSLLRRDPEENIVRWSWTQHAHYRRSYAELAASGNTAVLRLRSPRAARRWLADLTRVELDERTPSD